MPDDLYELYKDALRTGHVAMLRGRLAGAEAAYLEAARVAPSRPLPHIALGGVLLRLGRFDEAAERYATALSLAPRDEAALAGSAEALTHLGRVADAAAALDVVADIQAATDRLPEATETITHALELEETPARLHRHRTFLRELELSAGDHEAEQALARALRIREYADATGGPAPTHAEPAAAGEAEAEGAPSTGADIGAESGQPREGVVEAGEHVATVEPTEPEPGEASAAVAEAAPVAEPIADGLALATEADEALAAGDTARARGLLVEAARAFGQRGFDDAALDAADRALELAPEDTEIHLALVGLYADRGWRSLAADKLLLLGRLVDLGDDPATREQVCTLARERFPDDARLREYCALAR